MNRAPPFDLDAAWDWAFALLQRIALIFGDPVAIRDQRFMRRADIRTLLAWLRPLEILVRRLFLLEAARSAPPRPITRSPRNTTPAPALPAGERRRSFRILPSTERSRTSRAACAPKRDPFALVACGPLARRYNALVWALARPGPLIARLARRLHAGDPRALALARLKSGDDHRALSVADAAESAAAAIRDAREDFLRILAPAFDSS